MPRSTPTLRRRRLSAELKRLRQEACVEVETAAEALGCSTDKIHWIERAGWTKPRWRDVRDLLDTYGVAGDDPIRDELITLAKEGGQKDWWTPYSRMLSKKYTAYIGLEAEASEILTFQPLIMPGLLQTDDYARELISSGAAELSAEEVEKRVTVRAERRKILYGEDPTRLWAVVYEAALRCPVGGPEVMRAQLERLIELAQMPGITVQVLPFEAGPHPGLFGPFTLLSFPEGDPDAAYIETIGGELLLEEPAEVDPYRQVFRRLNVKALPPEATITLLSEEAART
ncbi:helix-turn-helix transcriptional regulator [Actinoallomurus sp. NPDC052308]|uniref:helix-turn-helix domain-containing protein n=1 Tax=Actinoallomurus sp. NPDC052308 TaxID=3155530 RepID=UPI00342958AC